MKTIFYANDIPLCTANARVASLFHVNQKGVVHHAGPGVTDDGGHTYTYVAGVAGPRAKNVFVAFAGAPA